MFDCALQAFADEAVVEMKVSGSLSGKRTWCYNTHWGIRKDQELCYLVAHGSLIWQRQLSKKVIGKSSYPFDGSQRPG